MKRNPQKEFSKKFINKYLSYYNDSPAEFPACTSKLQDNDKAALAFLSYGELGIGVVMDKTFDELMEIKIPGVGKIFPNVTPEKIVEGAEEANGSWGSVSMVKRIVGIT